MPACQRGRVRKRPAIPSQAVPTPGADRLPGQHLREQPEESGAEVRGAGVIAT
jgi:hypothetical protein